MTLRAVDDSDEPEDPGRLVHIARIFVTVPSGGSLSIEYMAEGVAEIDPTDVSVLEWWIGAMAAKEFAGEHLTWEFTLDRLESP
jgi:hypothetical protein